MRVGKGPASRAADGTTSDGADVALPTCLKVEDTKKITKGYSLKIVTWNIACWLRGPGRVQLEEQHVKPKADSVLPKAINWSEDLRDWGPFSALLVCSSRRKRCLSD
jgi:hypothetical protein